MKFFPIAALFLIPGLFVAGRGLPRVHPVRLSGDPSIDRYWFSPTRLTVSRGDTIVFQVESGGPHALGVDPAGLSAEGREAWSQALPRRTGSLRGPLLRADLPYSVIVPRAMRPGKYLFFCLAHRAYDMRLEVEVR